jgi:hypothetical protein
MIAEARAAVAGALAPQLALNFEGWRHSPVTGVHLWFDRAVTERPFAALLDRTVQSFFNQDRGRYLLLVVSASRSLVEAPRGEVVDLMRSDLAEFLPAATAIPGLHFAGDWTRTGWPATMEGAVRTGYLAPRRSQRQRGGRRGSCSRHA